MPSWRRVDVARRRPGKTWDLEEDLSDEVGILGSGSDHTAFAFFAGVPSIMYSYGKWGYPTYHTGFETFHLMDKMVDPGFWAAKNTSELRVLLT